MGSGAILGGSEGFRTYFGGFYWSRAFKWVPKIFMEFQGILRGLSRSFRRFKDIKGDFRGDSKSFQGVSEVFQGVLEGLKCVSGGLQRIMVFFLAILGCLRELQGGPDILEDIRNFKAFPGAF